MTPETLPPETRANISETLRRFADALEAGAHCRPDARMMITPIFDGSLRLMVDLQLYINHEAPPARRLNVRCCCEPRKLLGTLPYKPGQEYFEFRWIEETPSRLISHKELTLPVLPVTFPNGTRELAYKADGVDIETLRRIPGFQERV